VTERPDPHQEARVTALLDELARRKDHYKIERYFLDDGPLRRALYTKHGREAKNRHCPAGPGGAGPGY